QTPGTMDLGGANRTFSISVATLLVSTRVIDGGVIKSGAGLMQLTTANTYTGGTQLQAGTLQAADPAALGTGPVSFAGGSLALRSDAASASFGNAVTTGAANSITIDLGPVTPSHSTPTAFALGAATLGSALNVTGASGDSLAFNGGAILQN